VGKIVLARRHCNRFLFDGQYSTLEAVNMFDQLMAFVVESSVDVISYE
jgi:hypothetical protein